MHSKKVIENIQLLHECKKDRDEHLLQVIAEAQADNGSIDPMVLPANPAVHGEYDMDNSDELLELLGTLDEYTTAAANASKKSTESIYIEETIEAVEKVGRFTDIHAHESCTLNEETPNVGQQLASFVSATFEHVRLDAQWQEQLKSERERVRRSLIIGNYGNEDDTLDLHAVQNAVVTVIDSNNHDTNEFQNHGSILPVASVTTQFPSQKTVADEFTMYFLIYEKSTLKSETILSRL
ncbi:unnamed protein product [Didymodactylos carnosus]|nr:unnamed protein product [Didymodactylos carnosus]CAF3751083.1 unnamed protein product [Didymodactylos carnosus]